MKKFPLDKRYLVTEDGKVFSTRSGNLYRLKYQKDISGFYDRVCLGEKHYLVHRVVAMTYIPNPKDLPQVNHLNGVKDDNRVENLEWVTASDNQKHAYKHNLKRHPKGLLNGRQELEEWEVIEVYEKLLKGASNKSLSDLYNVSTAQILRIKKKEQWTHLTEKFPSMDVNSKRRDLTKDEVILVCEAIAKGFTAKETLEFVDFDMSKWQFYDIKRKKNNKEISDKYF